MEEADGERTYRCVCQKGWAGIHCNLPQPEVICGEKTIEIFIDDRIVTEQGLSSDVRFVQFYNAPSCFAEKRSGSYYLKVNAPYRECGVQIKHSGDDYTFSQQIVWNSISDAVERPVVLLDFKCTYEDKYAVSFGGITPTETSVEFVTSYGVFKVNMALYKSNNFVESNRYEARPVLSVEDDVCVSTDLKNVMPRDLVLTNRECWASAYRNGSGESHRLVSSKCADDPTAEMLSNGEGDSARFCFQVFKWKDSSQELYMHCVVNVCNATAGEDYCQCQNNRTRRSARSLSGIKDGAILTFGPWYVQDGDGKKGLHAGDQNLNERMYAPEGKTLTHKSGVVGSKSVFLIVVGVIILVIFIALGVVAAVYINCRRRSHDSKSTMRSGGEPVIMPDPVTCNSVVD